VPIATDDGGAVIGPGTISVHGTPTDSRSVIVSAQTCPVLVDGRLIPRDGGSVSAPFVSAQDCAIMIFPGPVRPDGPAIIGARLLSAVQIAALRSRSPVVAALNRCVRLRKGRQHR
jgi:hypothetical protein